MGIQNPLAHQDLPEQVRIYCLRALKLFVYGQGDLAVCRSVARPRKGDGQFLIAQIDRASLLPTADRASVPARPTVACPRLGKHLGLQRLTDGVQP